MTKKQHIEQLRIDIARADERRTMMKAQTDSYKGMMRSNKWPTEEYKLRKIKDETIMWQSFVQTKIELYAARISKNEAELQLIKEEILRLNREIFETTFPASRIYKRLGHQFTVKLSQSDAYKTNCVIECVICSLKIEKSTRSESPANLVRAIKLNERVLRPLGNTLVWSYVLTCNEQLIKNVIL